CSSIGTATRTSKGPNASRLRRSRFPPPRHRRKQLPKVLTLPSRRKKRARRPCRKKMDQRRPKRKKRKARLRQTKKKTRKKKRKKRRKKPRKISSRQDNQTTLIGPPGFDAWRIFFEWRAANVSPTRGEQVNPRWRVGLTLRGSLLSLY